MISAQTGYRGTVELRLPYGQHAALLTKRSSAWVWSHLRNGRRFLFGTMPAIVLLLMSAAFLVRNETPQQRLARF